MIQFKKYIKENFHLILHIVFVVLFVFFIGKYIYKQKELTDKLLSQKSDTIRTITQTIEKMVYLDRYKPIPMHDTLIREIRIPVEYQATGTLEEVNKKLISLDNKYFIEKKYQDSIKLKDTIGRDVGTVYINDEISQNEIKGRYIKYQLKPIKETITISNNIIEEARRKLLIGGEITVTPSTPFNAVAIGVIYQDKKNRLFQLMIGEMIGTNSRYYKAGFFSPISFRRK